MRETARELEFTRAAAGPNNLFAPFLTEGPENWRTLFADLTLVAAGDTWVHQEPEAVLLLAHRVVIAAYFPRLRARLARLRVDQYGHSLLDIRNEVNHRVLKDLLSLCYKGTVTVTHSAAAHLVEAIDHFGIQLDRYTERLFESFRDSTIAPRRARGHLGTGRDSTGRSILGIVYTFPQRERAPSTPPAANWVCEGDTPENQWSEVEEVTLDSGSRSSSEADDTEPIEESRRRSRDDSPDPPGGGNPPCGGAAAGNASSDLSVPPPGFERPTEVENGEAGGSGSEVNPERGTAADPVEGNAVALTLTAEALQAHAVPFGTVDSPSSWIAEQQRVQRELEQRGILRRWREALRIQANRRRERLFNDNPGAIVDALEEFNHSGFRVGVGVEVIRRGDASIIPPPIGFDPAEDRGGSAGATPASTPPPSYQDVQREDREARRREEEAAAL